MKEKALVLLSVAVIAHALPTTIVNFSPVGDSPNVAPGFAYAFRASEPLGGPEAPVYLDETVASANEAPPKVVKTQYHSQDQLGQYAFGYVGESSTKHEVRTADGAVRGSFTYLDAAGVLQTANYVADKNGYRVEASNLPQGPNEVATGPVAPAMEPPKPVQYTPEVLAARNAHFKAFEAVKASAAAAQARAAAKAATKKEPTSTRIKRSYPAAGYLPPPPPPKETKKYTPLVKNSKVPVKTFVAPAPLIDLPHNHDLHVLTHDGHVVHAISPAPELRKFFLNKPKAIKTPNVLAKYTPTKQIPLDGHIVHAPVDHINPSVHSVHEPFVHHPVEHTREVLLDGHIIHAPVPINTLHPPAIPRIHSHPTHDFITPVENTREVLLDGHIVHAPVPVNTLLPPTIPSIHSHPTHDFITPAENTREVLLDGHIVHAPVPTNSLLPPVHTESSYVSYTPVQQTREVPLDGHIVKAPIPVNTLFPPVNSFPAHLVHTQPQQTREVPFDGHIVHAPVPINSLPPVHPAPVQLVPKEVRLDGHIVHSPVPVNTLTLPTAPQVHPAPVQLVPKEVRLDGHIVQAPVPVNTLTVPTAPGSLFDPSIDYLDMPHKNFQIPNPLTNQAVFVKAEPGLDSTQITQQVLSQFHSQDELGGFEFGFSGGPSSRHEIRDHDGITRGSYSYVDPNGELQTVEYIADDFNGFRVHATNLPVDPASTTA